jgi:PAS domain S-box-containing protein
MTEYSTGEHKADESGVPRPPDQGGGEPGARGSSPPHADLSDAVDRVSRHELERRVGRLSAELTRLRRTLAPLARFRTIVDQAGEALLVIDSASGRFVDVNETALQWLGIERNRLLTLTVHDVRVEFPLEYRNTRPDHVTDTRNLDRPWVYSEGVHRRRDGSCFPVDVAVAQRRFADRSFTLVVARESAGRRRVDLELRVVEEDYVSLLDLSHDAIYVTRRDGRVANVNRAAIERFGYPREDFIGLEARALYAEPREIRKFQEIVEESGSVRDFRIQFRTRDGSVFAGFLSATLRHTGDGTIGGYQCVIHSTGQAVASEGESRMAGENERAAEERDEQGTEGPPADRGGGPGSEPALDEEAQPPESAENWQVAGVSAPSAELVAEELMLGSDLEELGRQETHLLYPGTGVPDVDTTGAATDRAMVEEQESDAIAPGASDDRKSAAESSEPSESSARSSHAEGPQAEVVLHQLSGSPYGYEMHQAGAAVVKSTRGSHRRHGERQDEAVRAAPWERKPAPPTVSSGRQSFHRWSLLTLGVALSVVGWSDSALLAFPYNMGIEEWHYALRILAGALIALGIAGTRGRVAAKPLAVAALGMALVLLTTYCAYLLDFPFGLEDVVSNAELDNARRQTSEFTAVTVLGCVWIAGYLWRVGRGR